MSVLDWIERMREEPEPVRRRLVFLISGGITAGIVLVWFFFSFVFQEPREEMTLPEDYAGGNGAAEVGGIFTQFKDGTREQFQALEGMVAEVKGQFLNTENREE